MSILCLVENACWLLWILNNVNWLCSLSSCSCHWITYREKLTQGQWNAIKNTACNLGKTVDWSMSWAVFYFSVLKYVMPLNSLFFYESLIFFSLIIMWGLRFSMFIWVLNFHMLYIVGLSLIKLEKHLLTHGKQHSLNPQLRKIV